MHNSDNVPVLAVDRKGKGKGSGFI